MISIKYLRQACCTAASLLLEPPKEEQMPYIRQLMNAGVTVAKCRQSFFELFGFPGSEHYLPLFEHVLLQAQKVGSQWTFPPARYDGAWAVEEEFDRFRFDWRRYTAHFPTAGGRFLADNVGLLLLFFASLIKDGDYQNKEFSKNYILLHRQAVDRLAEMLSDSPVPYAQLIMAVLNTVQEEIEDFLSIG